MATESFGLIQSNRRAPVLKPNNMNRPIEYNQPVTSPYELPLVTIHIGHKSYGLPASRLQRYSLLNNHTQFGEITLSDISEDIGHTIVHFLYSGAYETIDSPPDQVSSTVREYQRSIEVYYAALKYQFEDLKILAKGHLEYFGKEMEIVERLRPIRRAFSKLPKDETWLPNHVKHILRESFMFSKPKFSPDVLKLCEEPDAFSMAIMSSMIEILSAHVKSLDWSNQSLPIFDSKDHEMSPDEQIPDQKTEEVPEAAMSCEGNESDANYDSTVPNSQPAATKHAISGDKPLSEDLAAIGHSSSVIDEHGPTSEKATEDLIANLLLYGDWGSLSAKQRRRKAKKLRSRGLPVPDPDGVLSISLI